MRPDAPSIRQLAAERGFVPATMEKVLLLLNLLSEIDRHPFLRTRLVLKGGTALNLFYWDCPRLSVDIDVNYLGVPLEQMKEERPKVMAALEVIAKAGKYQIQYGKPEHSSRTMHLTYPSVIGSFDKIAVDVNFLMRSCFFDPQPHTCTLDPTRNFSTLSIEEIMAGKLTAMLDRTAARDLYDTYRFVRTENDYNKNRLRQAFFFYTTTGLPLPLWQYDISRLARIDKARVEQELWPVLASNDRPTISEMIDTVTPFLNELLDISTAERAFIESVLAGKPDTSLLFPDSIKLSDLATVHPALLWKVKNIQEYKG